MAVALLTTFLVAAQAAAAQVPDPVQANQALAERYERAWNTHDMTLLNGIVTDDVDWITVDANRGRGRDQVIEGHATVHRSPRYRDSKLSVKAVDVAPLGANVAIVHVYWRIVGDRNDNGRVREPRRGVMTWTTVRDGGRWRIRASHNTNRQYTHGPRSFLSPL